MENKLLEFELKKIAEEDENGVVGLKLMNGEFVIGKLEFYKENNRLSIRQPIIAYISENSAIGFAPWVPSSSLLYHLDTMEKAIIAVCSVPQNISDQYAIISGQKKVIAPPEKRIIVN